MICIAHRGASGTEPENTLRAIRRAVALGAPAVEIDVRLVEGELLVFHDARLERVTNGRGAFGRKSLACLRGLDAGAGERIPTLGEVCAEIAGRAWLNIELKGRRTGPPVAAAVRALVAAGPWTHAQFLVSSFLRRELRRFREADGGRTPLGFLLNRPTPLSLRHAIQAGAQAIHPPLRGTTARFVKKAHEKGLRVYVYTVNKPESFARMRALGVDGVFTDFPERCLP